MLHAQRINLVLPQESEMSLKKLSVRSKIYVLIGISICTLVGYGMFSYNTLSVAKVEGPYYKKIVQGKDLIADILPPPNYIIESYMMALHMANEVEEGASPQEMQAYVDRCKQLKAEFDERHDFWVNDLPEGEMKTKKTVDCFRPAVEFYGVLRNEFFPVCFAGDSDAANRIVRGKLRESYEVHRDAIDQVVKMATEKTVADEAEVSALVASRTTWSVIGIIAAIGAVTGIGVYVANNVVNPLFKSATKLRDLSKNRLTSVSNQIRSNAQETSDQANQVSSTADEVSNNAQSLATAVEQFEASIREISANTTNAASVARNAVDAAEKTNATVTRLGDSSAEIGSVIKVINSIAEQTNLLALNATIEAARAGEAGKGFAVVANEVKELAKETSKSTEDIINRIETIQADTAEAVEAIGRVSTIISEINESQNAIAGAVEEQTAMTSEISRNITEVASGSGEIARTIIQVADAAQNTTSGSDATDSTASEIEDTAMELLALVGMTSVNAREPLRIPAPSDSSQSGAGKYRIESPVA